jgi:hypothetical protein
MIAHSRTYHLGGFLAHITVDICKHQSVLYFISFANGDVVKFLLSMQGGWVELQLRKNNVFVTTDAPLALLIVSLTKYSSAGPKCGFALSVVPI